MSSKRFYLVFLIAALLLASFPVAGVFAAPNFQDDGPDGNDLEQSWTNKLSQLQGEIAFFNNFRTRPGQNRNNEDVARYLDRYSAAISAAQSLIVSGSGFTTTGEVVNQNQARQAIRKMNEYLSLMRGLREKIATAGGNTVNNNNFNTGSNSGVGIPVTGGDAETTVNQNNTGTSLASTWGDQWRQLQAAQAWFNRFRTRPGQDRNNEEISRYLDRYAFALQQANAIIAGGVDNTNNQPNGNGQGSNLGWGTPQQQLAQYLHMMRGLRQKIAQAGGSNNGDD
jgi:hypothetical protein